MCINNTKRWRKKVLTSSFVPAHPAEPRAGLKESPMADVYVPSLCHAHEDLRKTEESLFGGFS